MAIWCATEGVCVCVCVCVCGFPPSFFDFCGLIDLSYFLLNGKFSRWGALFAGLTYGFIRNSSLKASAEKKKAHAIEHKDAAAAQDPHHKDEKKAAAH